MNAINIIDRGPNALPIVTTDDKGVAKIVAHDFDVQRRIVAATVTGAARVVEVSITLRFTALYERDAQSTSGAANAHAGEAP